MMTMAYGATFVAIMATISLAAFVALRRGWRAEIPRWIHVPWWGLSVAAFCVAIAISPHRLHSGLFPWFRGRGDLAIDVPWIMMFVWISALNLRWVR